MLPTVSQLVRNDYRRADVLKKWGINYCCGGNLPLAEACTMKGLDQAVIETEMQKATTNISCRS